MLHIASTACKPATVACVQLDPHGRLSRSSRPLWPVYRPLERIEEAGLVEIIDQVRLSTHVGSRTSPSDAGAYISIHSDIIFLNAFEKIKIDSLVSYGPCRLNGPTAQEPIHLRRVCERVARLGETWMLSRAETNFSLSRTCWAWASTLNLKVPVPHESHFSPLRRRRPSTGIEPQLSWPKQRTCQV